MRKAFLGIFDLEGLKPACSANSYLLARNVGHRNQMYYTILAADNKDTNQTAQMRRCYDSEQTSEQADHILVFI